MTARVPGVRSRCAGKRVAQVGLGAAKVGRPRLFGERTGNLSRFTEYQQHARALVRVSIIKRGRSCANNALALLQWTPPVFIGKIPIQRLLQSLV